MPPADPLVSVIIPTHDRPERLGAALDTALAQTYRSLEVLVVDDASARPVDDVVGPRAERDRRVRLLRRQTNGGAAAARNTGLAAARGDLVAFLDDDDAWEPHKVARQVAYLAEHPGVGFVSCDHLLERPGRRPLRFRGPSHYTAAQLLWVNFAGSFTFVMVRRRLLAEHQPVDESLRCAEDWDLWLRCAETAAPGVLNEPLARYVAHRGPRLTDTEVKRRGLEAFADKHGALMSPECLAFHRAHQRMDTGAGWAKRAEVARAVAAAPPRVGALLAREQLARQWGRVRSDPGRAERTLARLVPG